MGTAQHRNVRHSTAHYNTAQHQTRRRRRCDQSPTALDIPMVPGALSDWNTLVSRSNTPLSRGTALQRAIALPRPSYLSLPRNGSNPGAQASASNHPRNTPLGAGRHSCSVTPAKGKPT